MTLKIQSLRINLLLSSLWNTAWLTYRGWSTIFSEKNVEYLKSSSCLYLVKPRCRWWPVGDIHAITKNTDCIWCMIPTTFMKCWLPSSNKISKMSPTYHHAHPPCFFTNTPSVVKVCSLNFVWDSVKVQDIAWCLENDIILFLVGVTELTNLHVS